MAANFITLQYCGLSRYSVLAIAKMQRLSRYKQDISKLLFHLYDYYIIIAFIFDYLKFRGQFCFLVVYFSLVRSEPQLFTVVVTG